MLARVTRDSTNASVGRWLLLLAWVLSACAEPSEPLNVVLITLDPFRADALGIHGNTGGHTPNIDSLADESTVFSNALTPIGTTHPSHASMFTGLYPKNHGVRWNGDGLDEGFTTLAETLAGEGYETAAFVSVGSMLRRGGLRSFRPVFGGACAVRGKLATRSVCGKRGPPAGKGGEVSAAAPSRPRARANLSR